jgi:hypothetical protein
MDKLEDNFGVPQASPGVEQQSVRAYRIRAAWMRFANRARALAPWFSLSVGVLSAWFVMGLGPAASGRVALAIFGVWALILLQRWLASIPTPERVWVARLTYVARLSSLMATQSFLQMKLFFALPFFLKAADFSELGHDIFLLSLAGLCAVSLWDPLTERWLAGRRLAALLPATSSFVALTAVLPLLGLSTSLSLWLSACVGGGGAALVMLLHTPRGERMRSGPHAALVALALPTALVFGAGRFVPAAPLRLAKIEFGSETHDHWISQPVARGGVAPAKLVCATAIASPLGVRDRLFHVWQKNDQLRARIELEVVGGRTDGYRTASRIPIGPMEGGQFKCSVTTISGQVLGGQTIRLRPREH